MRFASLAVLVFLSACNCGLHTVDECPGAGCPDGGKTDAGSGTGGGSSSNGGGVGTGGGSASGGGSSVGGGSALGGGSATGGGSAAPCSTLTLGECRQRAECTPDMCFACTCAPSFHGCRGINEAAFMCPGFGCASPICCTTTAECSSPLMCVQPSAPGCGGQCFNGTGDCTTDASCNAGDICEPIPCACASPGPKRCVSGCGITGCDDFGSACNSTTARCEVVACGTPGTICPLGSACSNGACTPRSCNTDQDCDVGVCQFGHCQKSRGVCRGNPP